MGDLKSPSTPLERSNKVIKDLIAFIEKRDSLVQWLTTILALHLVVDVLYLTLRLL